MFAERLKEARRAKKYSQAELSHRLGVTQQAVGKWETGRSTPDPQTVAQLAEILDTTADALLGLREKFRPRCGRPQRFCQLWRIPDPRRRHGPCRLRCARL